MTQKYVVEIPRLYLSILNNLYEIEKKLAIHGDAGNAARNIEKMKESLAETGIFYEDPMGQEFKETRTDLDATISGSGTEQLIVVEVIKPIIRTGESTYSRVVQKGIVIVQSREGSKQ
ncbi:hypothetical protein SAMN05216296_0058 [Pseudomonas pohangensis]|uniref:Uncharacterized protein n=1 Tax=Pseudomonas pohangensis TaxID=364197 RepID=A0A1H2DWP9_9PSED|nr:hypothetical protein [Pseudomonas pohangensis]SDT86868.1 hypothetical protein SAMN05216296_0058 [Pseudomonas pohangensis]